VLPRSPASRWVRALRFVAFAFGGLFALIVVFVALALVLVDLPFARRLAVRELNAVLASDFKGKLTIENVASLHVWGVGGVDVRITAPDGTDVIVARGVRARIAPIALLASFLRRREPLRVDVFDVDARSIDVDVDSDASGDLKLVAAFEPLHPAQTTSSGRPTRLQFPRLSVEHTHVHGQMKGAPPIDADLDGFDGSALIAPDATAIDVSEVRLTARGMPRGANPHGIVAAHLSIPSKAGANLGFDASFGGDVGGIPATAKASMDGDQLDAVMDIPKVTGDKIRAVVANAPIYAPAAAHVEAHGTLSALRATVRGSVGGAELAIRVIAAVTGKLEATATVDIRDVDLRAFSPTAQASSLGLHADVRVETNRVDGLAGHFALTTPDATFGAQAIPHSAFAGEFEQRPGNNNALDLAVRGTIYEPGAPVTVRVDVDTEPPAPIVTLDVGTTVARLADITRFGGLGSGSAHFHVAGSTTLSTHPSLDLALDADIRGFAHADARVNSAKVTVRAVGSLTSPTLHAAVDASGLRAGRYAFSSAHVAVDGPLVRESVRASLRGDKTSSVGVRAIVGLGAATTVDDAQIAIERGRDALRVHVDRVHATSGELDIVGARMTGIGGPAQLDLRLRPGALTMKGDSKAIDLKALGNLLGIEDTLRRGRLAFAVDLSAQPNGATGAATIDVMDGCFANVDGLTGHTEMRIDGRKVTGALKAAATGIGTVDATDVNLEIGGRGPLAASSWRRAWGKLHIGGHGDLKQIATLLPANVPPLFARMAGSLALDADIERGNEADVTPNIKLTLTTSDLMLGGRGAPDVVSHGTVLVAPQAWTLSGFDMKIDAATNGTTGATAIGVSLLDKQGTLASIRAKSPSIPFGPLIASSDGLVARMLSVPFSAVVDLPQRDLGGLPPMLQLGRMSGDEQATISIEGTCLDPAVHVQVKVHSVKFEASNIVTPLDADLTAKYEGVRGDVALDVRSSGEMLLRASAHTDASLAAVLTGKSDLAPWSASANAKLTRFPLDSIGPLSNRHMHGSVSGDFELTNFHKDARVRANVDLSDLQIGKAKYGSAKLKAGFDGRAFKADVRLDQGTGFADANARVDMTWGASAAPVANPSGSAEASLQAKHFQAGLLAPFLQATMDEFEGTLDADARISLVAEKKPAMSGSVTFSHGVVELVALGQELREVTSKITFTPDGIVRLSDASALGTSGKLTAAGVARFDGTTLVAAEADVKIAKRNAIPVDVQGSDVGTVYGQLAVKATASADHKTMNLNVAVPSLHVELPQADTHSVESLDEPPPQVHVGVYETPSRFVSLHLDGAKSEPPTGSSSRGKVTVSVHLGNDVEIKRGTDLKVDLDGDVTAELEEKTRLHGQIRLREGKLDVKGKSFDIEHGTVTFVGDPANPEVNATAGWTAGDGTRVFADYVGPLKTGKVSLRSEPARPQNEIVALIAFGTADGSEATPYATPQPNGTGTQAGTVAGGFATAGLTQGLDKLTGVDITAKLDTSQANPRPEVEVQIAKDISLQLAVVIGTPPPGTNPDTTYVTVDWRFLRQWSLETTFGDMGSSIADVVWQHRY